MEPTVPCRLVIESDDNRGMIFPLREDFVSIGRGPQNTIQIIDTRMSRAHARLDRADAGWTVRDLQSKNGVLVNEAPINAAVRLNPGDQIQVGSTLFTFETDVASTVDDKKSGDSSVRLVDDETTDLETSQIFQLPSDDETEIAAVKQVPAAGEERLKSIYRIGKLIQSILELDVLLNKVMEIVCQVLQPTQACIMLYDKKQKALVPKVLHRPPDSESDIIISGSVIHQALEDRVAVLMGDGQKDTRFKASDSVVGQQIHSAICAPLISKGEVFGALYLDKRGPSANYTESDLEWAAGVAGQAALAIAISLLHAEMIAKHEQEREIQIARTIQMNLLPKTMPKIRGFELGGLSRPARMVGGDYYDLIDLDGGNYALTIADVSGKGVASALLLASFRSATRMEARDLDRDNLVEVVERLNETICKETTNNMYITMVLALFEPQARRLTFCNAGHAYPILRKPDGGLVNLEAGGSFLGIMPGMNFEMQSVELQAGSLTVFVTDGISDSLNAQGDTFGTARLTEFIQSHAKLSAQEFCVQLEAAVRQFQGDAEQFDDFTVMALRAV